MQKKKVKERLKRRNESLFDFWSLTHITWGVFFGWIMNPFAALVIMVLWEPLEVLIISPIVAKFGYEFGYESIRNSLSDIFFDVIGVIIGAYLLTKLFTPPFYLF
jgi:hypothetical protein